MKFAILIVTYTSAKQTRRLIECLNNGDFDFYIHVDKKVDIQTHRDLFDIPNVYFIEDRIDIKWAGYTTVQAALSCIRQVVASGIKYDFLNLVTGQDYPIKPAAYISDFLQQNTGSEFMLFQDFETDWTEAKARVDRYHFTDLGFKGRHRLEKIVNFFTFKRKLPVDMHLYGKETFWTLSLDCAAYVANYIDGNKKLSRFLRYTWGSDEFIFQSIIMNSDFKDRVVNKNYRYIDWPPGSARPKVLLTEDYDRIMASDSLFGRKFDINTDEHILDLLDRANGIPL
ncbi:beta-1,6-N-acetylglucosaminyltransferase [Mucilaginibacter sp. PPCGB 2223]|uniref:beta-1,6-N-acetylglucosaminyltransferase n=1 Tax=Mucilaginibacter sp. PPCGB 2223 TaxID=1886027 RepID=UPI001586C172|nr:beta-1,6-N-acetylglucosaminyltransferase [Mucilaginibacter sp. PPCGB 2223]